MAITKSSPFTHWTAWIAQPSVAASIDVSVEDGGDWGCGGGNDGRGDVDGGGGGVGTCRQLFHVTIMTEAWAGAMLAVLWALMMMVTAVFDSCRLLMGMEDEVIIVLMMMAVLTFMRGY